MTENFWEDRNLSEIRKTFASSLDDNEFELFVGLGKALGANPFKREIWALKDGKQKAQIFCGRDLYRRKAEEQPNYNGHQVDSVYTNDSYSVKNGIVDHVIKSFTNRGIIYGAYCTVHRKGVDHPYYIFVKYDEYKKNDGGWIQMPETMIKKVAEAQGLRGAFQGIFGGTYDESERWFDESSSRTKKDDIEFGAASDESLPWTDEKELNLILNQYLKDNDKQKLLDFCKTRRFKNTFKDIVKARIKAQDSSNETQIGKEVKPMERLEPNTNFDKEPKIEIETESSSIDVTKEIQGVLEQLTKAKNETDLKNIWINLSKAIKGNTAVIKCHARMRVKLKAKSK